jgi:hypothetical protein
VGDRWVVETVTRQVQISRPQPPAGQGTSVRWQFTVRGVERVAGVDCYRVEVRPTVAGPSQPLTILWADRQTLTLRRFQTELRVAGNLVTVTENYEPVGGQPTPVQCPLTALPIDMPTFAGGQSKGLQQFNYDAVVGTGGKKGIGDLGFHFEISQDVAAAKIDDVRKLLGEGFSKDLDAQPIMEVRLKTIEREVRQMWRAGSPWPVYCQSGPTTARLLTVTTAATSGAKPGEVH